MPFKHFFEKRVVSLESEPLISKTHGSRNKCLRLDSYRRDWLVSQHEVHFWKIHIALFLKKDSMFINTYDSLETKCSISIPISFSDK